MSTQIAHLMHTPAKGCFWRKRYDKKIIDVMLNTKDEAEATPRCAAVTIRFMELQILGVPFEAMRTTLKGCRDNLIKQDKLNRLQKLVSVAASPEALQDGFVPVAMQSTTLAERIEQETLQRVSKWLTFQVFALHGLLSMLRAHHKPHKAT